MGSNLPLLSRRRRAGGFSPALIFAASEQGFWGEVVPANLWQDTGRTTAAVADGDPVASWALNTTAGVIYATQNTAGNRPVYKTSGGLHWLEFNGSTSNRWLQTSTITPGTDKVQLFAGVRKASDATRGMLVESSGSLVTNSGTLYLASPEVPASQDYNFVSKGTTASGAQATNRVAPITNVVTGLGDISGDIATIRVNGTQVAQTTTDQGSGNYAAHPIYIGRRGGTTLPFNGNLYSLIIRFGANLDTDTISAVERWVGAKTGVVI